MLDELLGMLTESNFADMLEPLEVEQLFADMLESLEVDQLPADFDLPSPLEQSAVMSANISGLPEPLKIIDRPFWDNAGMNSMGTDDFTDDIRYGDNLRVVSQELKYGPGGSLPESLHEDAHRMPDIRSAGEKYGPQVEEIHCDIRSGMLSGWAGLPKDAFNGEIGPTMGDFEHPDGIDRVPYYEKAYDIAANDPFKDFTHPDNNPLLQAKIEGLKQAGIRQFGKKRCNVCFDAE